jgi:hypothetical protein
MPPPERDDLALLSLEAFELSPECDELISWCEVRSAFIGGRRFYVLRCDLLPKFLRELRCKLPL